MDDHKKGSLAIIIASPFLYMIFGLGLLIFPTVVLEYLCPVLAVVAAVFGVIEIYSYLTRPASENFHSNGFASGVILLVLAVMIFAQKEWFMKQIVVLLGFLVALNGVRELQNWVDIVRLKVSNAWITALVALLSLILGVAVMTNVPLIADIRLTVAAVGLLFSGLADHITTIVAYAKGKAEAKKKAKEETASVDSACAPSGEEVGRPAVAVTDSGPQDRENLLDETANIKDTEGKNK